MNTTRTKKTGYQNRGTYTYEFLTGEKLVLKPGINEVGAEWIKLLHSEDDKEANNNNDSFGVEIPNPQYNPLDPKNRNKNKRLYHERFDYNVETEFGFEDDKTQVQLQASITNPVDSTDTIIRRLSIREIVETKLTSSMKKVIALMDYGYKATEIAQILGVSDAAITKTKKNIAAILKSCDVYR